MGPLSHSGVAREGQVGARARRASFGGAPAHFLQAFKNAF